jgi:hypothetical protein
MCRLVVGALGTGVTEAGKLTADIKKVQQALMDAARPLIDPIRKPLEEKLTGAVNRVVKESKVDDALDDLEQPIKPYVDDGVAFAKNLSDKKAELQAVLLDPKVMCAGDAKVILKEVQKYLAKIGKNFVTVTLSASFKHPQYQPRVVIGITFATNLDNKAGLYFGVGLEMNAPVDPSVANISLGGAFYPGRTLADFGLTPIPELGFSLAKGGAWDEAVKKMPPLSTLALVDSLDVAWDFDIKHIPAFGISKELAHFGPTNTKGIFSASANVGWGIPILVYDGS